MISFVYNLIASENGCKIPINPTLFGPNRICIYPKIFRSNKVIKATATKEVIVKIIKLIIVK